MGTCRWQDELEEALKYANTIIICGNINDKYICEDKSSVRILDLREYLIHRLSGSCNEIIFYDPIDKEETHFPFGEPRPKERIDAGDERDAARLELSDTAFSARDGKRGEDSTVDRDIMRALRKLRESESTAYVIRYADKATPERADTEEGMKMILALEKMTDEMRPSNKLVLIYSFRDQIPRELYVNQPNAKVVEIPIPERSQLELLFREIFGLEDGDLERARNCADGLRIAEIEKIISALDKGFEIKAFEDGVRLYKYGREENPWNEISLEKINEAFDSFTREVKGQDEAIEKVIRVVVRARADIQRKTGGNHRSPRGRLFFAGPTGVGKTLTAKKLAEFLFGSKEALLRFDMSEFSQEFQVSRLYGAPPGYIGFERGGKLTNDIKAKPFSVVLFDEIEKAHPRVFDIFLQILEDGRLTDSRGETVYFSEAVLIFTSNLGTRTVDVNGRECGEKRQLDKLRGCASSDVERIKEHFIEAVENFFQVEISRPELLNRIGRDNIVVFNFIDAGETIKAMYDHYLAQVRDEFNRSYMNSKPSLRMEIEEGRVREYLYETSVADIRAFGGRNVESVIDALLRDELARCVLQAEYDGRESATIHISVNEGGLRFELS